MYDLVKKLFVYIINNRSSAADYSVTAMTNQRISNWRTNVDEEATGQTGQLVTLLKLQSLIKITLLKLEEAIINKFAKNSA